MSEWIEQEELEKYAGNSIKRINASLWLMAVTSGSYAECYRLIKPLEHLLDHKITKHWDMLKGKNQMQFLATTSQSSLGHSHPRTLGRRRRVETGGVKKLSGGKFSPKQYEPPRSPKRMPGSWVCTVCGQHELTAGHDTKNLTNFHHRFSRDIKQHKFLGKLRREGMSYTVSPREDLGHLKAEGKI